MLFKSLRLSHRTTIFIAVFYSASQLIKWKHGTPFRSFDLVPLLFFWGIVVFQALQRRNPSWQSAGGFGQPNLVDSFGSWFDRLPASAKFTYWMVVILAAVIIYWVV